MDTAQSIAAIILLICVGVAPILYAFYSGVGLKPVLLGWLLWILWAVLMTAGDFSIASIVAATVIGGWLFSMIQVALGGGLRFLAFKFNVGWANRVLQPSHPRRDAEAPSPAPSETIQCLRCQTLIPSGQQKCPACGWTYEQKS